MNVRISHCSTSLENYYTCVREQVSGYLNRGPQSGDLIYLVVKVGKKSVCGVRFVLDEPTDNKPWPDGDNYVNVFTITNIEYCQPFDISILAGVGGKYWAIKYIQGAKPVTDPIAVKTLTEAFDRNKTDHLVEFDIPPVKHDHSAAFSAGENEPAAVTVTSDFIVEDERELGKIIKEVPDAQLNIMGTFQTIHFTNETDKIRGLEALVNDNFYFLFPQFPPARTLLIAENRLFRTSGPKLDGSSVQGIRTIPDGLLIVFDRKHKHPFQVNIIEYECYGERKTRETDKSHYLNSIIIPQLMRFASAFSIITDDKTRESTVKTWVDKIIDYINSEEQLGGKVIGWIKEISPNIKERSIEREIEKQLTEAFKTNLRVLLVIDELSAEQKSTIKNVVSSFKLANGDNVQFSGYVVRLVQRINVINNESEYALTIQ